MRNIRSNGGREWSEVVFSAAKFIQHFANPRFKSRQIFRYGFPDDGDIHAHVIMDELVTHPGYFPPWDLRVFLADGGWDFPGGLTDHFQATNDGKKRFFIGGELIGIQPADEFRDFSRSVENVREIISRIPFRFHTTTISCRMVFPSRGLSASRITRSILIPSKSAR